MRKTTIVLAVAVFTVVIGYASEPQKMQSTTASPGPTENQSVSNDSYTPPTIEELAPMRAEYSAELAKVDEPPEMAKKPMKTRKSASFKTIRALNVMSSIGSPEMATHSQRAAAINELVELAKDKELDNSFDRTTLYGAVAMMACIDGADPQVVIGYANHAIGDEGDEALALRARMYLKAGMLGNALDDLEKVMIDRKGHALIGGDVAPRKESASCGWSIADFNVFGTDPRALAAKGLYLSSFLAFGGKEKGATSETDIQDLFTRSSRSWHSPIPHYLAISTYGLGSSHSLTGASCIRTSFGGTFSKSENACEKFDEEIREQIRELTMALLIDPKFAPALAERAGRYLTLAQAANADNKPSRALFKLAIKDYTAALVEGSKDKHALYCDRALAQASIGMYRDAALGYEQGMKYAKNGIEDSPFVYEQLAGVYLKQKKFNEAADLITQAIINASGGGMDVVIFHGGIKAFRTLYPEYGLLPDKILAEAVRRRYYPQFPQSWDADFISNGGAFKGKINSTILPELYIMRGDAYMKAGQSKKALADYRRVKSDAWGEEDRFMPRHLYFDDKGGRNYNAPEPFPPPPAKL